MSGQSRAHSNSTGRCSQRDYYKFLSCCSIVFPFSTPDFYSQILWVLCALSLCCDHHEAKGRNKIIKMPYSGKSKSKQEKTSREPRHSPATSISGACSALPVVFRAEQPMLCLHEPLCPELSRRALTLFKVIAPAIYSLLHHFFFLTSSL